MEKKISKPKEIFAYIINFIFIGSGFVVIQGTKGFGLAFLYLISFGILAILFVPETNTLLSNLSLIGRVVIYIICYIHLYKKIKE